MKAEEGTEGSPQEYGNPLLVLTGEEYSRISFQDLHRGFCDAFRGNRAPVVAEILGPDGEHRIIRLDEAMKVVFTESASTPSAYRGDAFGCPRVSRSACRKRIRHRERLQRRRREVQASQRSLFRRIPDYAPIASSFSPYTSLDIQGGAVILRDAAQSELYDA